MVRRASARWAVHGLLELVVVRDHEDLGQRLAHVRLCARQRQHRQLEEHRPTARGVASLSHSSRDVTKVGEVQFINATTNTR